MRSDAPRKNLTPRRALRRALVVMLTAAFVGTVANGAGARQERDNDHEGNRTFSIGLWGDLPYSVLQATVGVPNLIADMNSQNLAFTVHDGDLKAGSNSSCDNALYAQAKAYLNALEAPAMFTPGDNDWTDCDRPSNGGFSSLERLDYERQIFSVRRSRSANIACTSRCRPSPCASVSADWCRASRTGGGPFAASRSRR
jgi:hypothetical protein